MPYRLFIVDDAPVVREALRWAFEEINDFVIVGEAADGPAALERVATLAPDVVILDIELPRLNGYEVARRLKALPRPPVIICLTVHSDPAIRRRSLALGVDGFVEKGAGWASLIAQIRAALEKDEK